MIWVVAVPNTGLVQDPEVRPARSEAADTGVRIDPVEAECARPLEHASAQGHRDRGRPVVRQSDFRRVGSARGQQVNEHVPVLSREPSGNPLVHVGGDALDFFGHLDRSERVGKARSLGDRFLVDVIGRRLEDRLDNRGRRHLSAMRGGVRLHDQGDDSRDVRRGLRCPRKENVEGILSAEHLVHRDACDPRFADSEDVRTRLAKAIRATAGEAHDVSIRSRAERAVQTKRPRMLGPTAVPVSAAKQLEEPEDVRARRGARLDGRRSGRRLLRGVPRALVTGGLHKHGVRCVDRVQVILQAAVVLPSRRGLVEPAPAVARDVRLVSGPGGSIGAFDGEGPGVVNRCARFEHRDADDLRPRRLTPGVEERAGHTGGPARGGCRGRGPVAAVAADEVRAKSPDQIAVRRDEQIVAVTAGEDVRVRQGHTGLVARSYHGSGEGWREEGDVPRREIDSPRLELVHDEEEVANPEIVKPVDLARIHVDFVVGALSQLVSEAVSEHAVDSGQVVILKERCGSHKRSAQEIVSRGKELRRVFLVPGGARVEHFEDVFSRAWPVRPVHGQGRQVHREVVVDIGREVSVCEERKLLLPGRAGDHDFIGHRR